METLRIAVDARPLTSGQVGGFRTYLRSLLIGLRERQDAGGGLPRLLLYLGRPPTPELIATLPTGTETRVLSPNRLRVDARLWRTQIRADAPDLVFGTQNYLPDTGDGSNPIASVVVLHDAIGIKRYAWERDTPRTLRERVTHRYWQWQTLRSARRATRVITVSGGARDEIRSVLTDLPGSRFVTIYNGIALPTPRLGGGRDVGTILCIASPDPRKNLTLLFDVLKNHRARIGDGVLRLRVVCASADVAARTGAVLAVYGLDAELITGLDNQGLADVYARSTVFVWPSHQEGFGLPPLEMMATGGVVASSDAICMPEVLGDAPVYFSPLSAVGLADAVGALLRDPVARRERGERGRAHAATFTCRRMADETIAVWEQVAGGSRPPPR